LAQSLPQGRDPDRRIDARSSIKAKAGIARTPWSHPKELIGLFGRSLSPAERRRVTRGAISSYLAYAPPDFTLMLSFASGGVYASGKFMFDAVDNLWSGVNWMPGSQSGVTHNLARGTIKFARNGSTL
jgi:hypothetical protein